MKKLVLCMFGENGIYAKVDLGVWLTDEFIEDSLISDTKDSFELIYNEIKITITREKIRKLLNDTKNKKIT